MGFLDNLLSGIIDSNKTGGFSQGSAKAQKSGGGSNAPSASKGSAKATSYAKTGKSTSTTMGATKGTTPQKTTPKKSGGTGGGSTADTGSTKPSAAQQALEDYATQSAVDRAKSIVEAPAENYGFSALNADTNAAIDRLKNAKTNFDNANNSFGIGTKEYDDAYASLQTALAEAETFIKAAKSAPAGVNRNTFNVEEYYEKAKETPTTTSLLLADEGAYSAKRTEMLTDATDEEKEKLAQLQEQDKQNGTNEAEAYRREIETRIAQERGAAKAEEIQGKEGLGKALSYGGQAVQSGFGKTMNDLAKTFGVDMQDKTQAEYTAGILRQGLEETGSEAAKTGFDVAQGIGAMIPSLVASSVPGGALAGKAVQGLTSASSAYQDKLAEGWGQGEAATYGLLEAASEVALSSALGGISKLGGTKSLSNLSKALTGKINNVLLRATANASIRALAEGGEEAMQTYISPAIESVVRSVPYDSPDFEEVLHNAVVGAATSAVLGVGEFASDIRNTTETPTVEAKQPAVPTTSTQAPQSANNAPSIEGGEITPDVSQSVENASPVELNNAVKQTNKPIKDGTVVKALDRGNFGYVQGYNSDTNTYSVRFTSKDGLTQVVDMPANMVQATNAKNVREARKKAGRPELEVPQVREARTAKPSIQKPPPSDRTVTTESKYLENLLNEDERQIEGLTEEDFTHEQRHDANVNAEADQRIASDGAEKVQDDLMSKPADSWNDADVVAAQKVLSSEVEAARQLTGEDAAKAYANIAKLAKAYRDSGTETARSLRQRKGFDTSIEGMTAAATETLFEDNANTRKGITNERKVEIVKQVADLATRYNNIADGDVDSVIELIKTVSVVRRTTGLFSNQNSKAINAALKEVATFEGGEAFLRDKAAVQIKSIASDYIRPGIINQLKSLRFMNMLSNPATGVTNAGSNFTFGSFMEAITTDFALPMDMFMSKFTGKREVALDLGAFSATKWQGSYEAAVKSFIEVSLDAEGEQANYGYNEIKGGTFKMVGSPLERWLATVQKYQGYVMKTTDQAAKGGASAVVKESLGKLAEQGKAKAEDIETIANQTAEYRTLQNNSKISKATSKVRSALDEIHIGNEKTGKYGLGSDIMPFAQIPANSVLNVLSYNPSVGAPVALYKTAKTIMDAKNGTLAPGQQADAVRSWGRVANGAAIIALASSLAAKGLLQDFEDEDKDVNSQRKAEGRSGVQLNLSATLRSFAGEETIPEDGDVWVDFSWMPVLNALMNMGVDVYESKQDDGKMDLRELGMSSWDSTVDAIMDFPAVSKISQIVNTIKYSEAEGWGKALEVATTSAADTVSSLVVPNAVKSVAAGLDEYERDVYNSDSYAQDIINETISGVPGLRTAMLEPRLDNFGNPIQNEGGALNFVDRVLLPGNYSVHNQSEASKIVEDIYAKTGDASVMPSRNPPYNLTIDGEKIKLTSEERRAYQQEAGKMAEAMILDSAQLPVFKTITPEQQVDVLGDILSYTKSRATATVAENNDKKYKSDWDDEANLPDLPFYLTSKTAYSDATDAENDAPNYDAVNLVLNGLATADKATVDALDKQDGFKSLRFAYDMFGMDAETAITNRNMISETQKTSLGGKDGGSADMAAIAKNVKGSDADKLAALEVANTPDAKTGKRQAIVRRTEAAMAQGIPFDDWAKIETYITDAGSTSRATIMTAGEKYGYKGYEVYNIYKKVSADDEVVTQVNDYFSKDYIAPDKVSLSEYLTGEEVDETDKASSGGGGRGGYGGRYRGGSSKPANLGNSVNAVRSIANSSTTSNSSKYMRQALNDAIAQSKKQQATQPTVKWEDLLAGYVKGIK